MTLAEKLATLDSIFEYLDEVEATRVNGFGFLRSDADLERNIPARVELRPIGQLLLDAISRSAHFQDRAFAIFQIVSAQKPPRL